MSTNRILSSNSPSDLVHVRFNRSEQRSLLRLYLRGDLRNRRLCVDYLRAGLGVRGNRQFILKMCDRMIPDRSTYVRWQALLILGQQAEHHPDEIWPASGPVPSTFWAAQRRTWKSSLRKASTSTGTATASC